MHNITFAIQANTKKKGRENGAITFSSMSESFINAIRHIMENKILKTIIIFQIQVKSPICPGITNLIISQ